jgi:hypothetical protein
MVPRKSIRLFGPIKSALMLFLSFVDFAQAPLARRGFGSSAAPAGSIGFILAYAVRSAISGGGVALQ